MIDSLRVGTTSCSFLSLKKCFSNLNVNADHLGILLKFKFWVTCFGIGLKVCFPSKLPGDVLAAGLRSSRALT